MKKVVLMEGLGITPEALAALEAEFAGEVTFTSYPKTTDVEKLIQQAKDADAMILANTPMPDQVIAACQNLKFIDVAFTGVDHVGLQAARDRQITVSNASGYSTEAVAELVLGAVLSRARQSIIPPSSVSLMGETENEESSSLLISFGSYKTLS